MEELKLLLVDDEERFLETTCKLLVKKGISTLTATGAESAMEVIRENRPHVVILDVKMPGMDGIATLRAIKRDYPMTEVIMLTGHATVESAIEGLKSGARDYLMKPVDIDEIMEKAKAAFNSRQQIEARIRVAQMRKVMKSPQEILNENNKGRVALMAKKIKVLMVDDEAQFRATTSRILIKKGFQTTIAASGEEAIDILKKFPQDIVILDIMMPGMDGHKALSEIKALAPETQVIMLTGHGGLDSAKASLTQGAYDYLTKPCDIDLLASKITSAYETAHEKRSKGREDCRRHHDSYCGLYNHNNGYHRWRRDFRSSPVF